MKGESIYSGKSSTSDLANNTIFSILQKLEKLTHQRSILVVLLSLIYATMILVLVPLVQLFALPFTTAYVIFTLVAIQTLSDTQTAQEKKDAETSSLEVNPSSVLNLSYFKSTRTDVEKALILRYVLLNYPNSSASKIASAVECNECIVRNHLHDLLSKELVEKEVIDFVDVFKISDDLFHVVVEVLRKLTTLEEQIKDFHVY